MGSIAGAGLLIGGFTSILVGANDISRANALKRQRAISLSPVVGPAGAGVRVAAAF